MLGIANSIEFERRLLHYCDEHDIYCGIDDRKYYTNDIKEYVFYKDGKGTMIGVKYGEVSSFTDVLSTTIDHLDYVFYYGGDYQTELRRAEVKRVISDYKKNSGKFEIEKVIFNKPATIVFWADGTKTVVKRQKGDRYDKEKGLAMAIAKKLYGNTGKYCDIFKEHLQTTQED